MSRRHQDTVCLEREAQIKIKESLKKRDQEVEKMYADMWERDRQIKAQREEDEARAQLESNRETLRVCITYIIPCTLTIESAYNFYFFYFNIQNYIILKGHP